MRQAARLVGQFVEGMTLEQFRADERTRSAVERQLEILGEAAKHIAPQTAAKYPHLDWRGLRGLRDVLSHGYFRIDPAIVWRVVQEECPLVAKLDDPDLGPEAA